MCMGVSRDGGNHHISIIWVLPRLSYSWIIMILWLFIALNGTPNIDSYWVGAVPNP